jgi:hypothetical protein
MDTVVRPKQVIYWCNLVTRTVIRRRPNAATTENKITIIPLDVSRCQCKESRTESISSRRSCAVLEKIAGSPHP